MADADDPQVALLAERLLEWLREHRVSDRGYAVALSGGVDSAVVAKAAVLSDCPVIAVTARSDSVSAVERRDARELAEAVGIEHHWVEPHELSDPAYQQNDLRRCYFCKSRLYAAISASFPQHQILSGTNHDDLGDYRPGLEAAAEARVQAPLAELSIGKSQVRQLARYWNLDVADKPASPCLASRIAYGVAVTSERLDRIERAERLLRELGWGEFRVRLHADEVARLEVPAASIERLASDDIRSRVVRELKQLGFRYVTLDLEGFRSGSLNPVFQIQS
ncbi:MAG: ATP-dependent sacrificial sulfur transferase LarE [Aureliella sp.]